MFTPFFLTVMISPGVTSREGLAFKSATFTFPALQDSLARERVLNILVAHNHLSTRTVLSQSVIFRHYFL